MESQVEPHAIGDVIDALGIEVALNEGELVSGAVVLLKVIEDDGTVRLHAAWSDGLSWIERLGMIGAARVSDEQGLD